VETADRDKVELQRRRDPEVALAAAHRPEQVRLAVRVDPPDLPVSGDEIEAADEVRRKPISPAQHRAEAAAEGVAQYTHSCVGPDEARQAVRLRLRQQVRPTCARLHPRSPRHRVHLDTGQPTGTNQNRAIDRAGRAVPGALHCDRQACLRGVPHGGDDVLDRRRPHGDRRGVGERQVRARGLGRDPAVTCLMDRPGDDGAEPVNPDVLGS
jgi:hypothetical protein